MAEVEEPRLSLRKKTRTELFDPSACSQTPQMLHVVSAKRQFSSPSPPPPPTPANNKQTKATNADAAGQKRGRKEEEVQKKEKKGDVMVRFVTLPQTDIYSIPFTATN